MPESFSVFMKTIACIASIVGMLYVYIDRQNELMDLRIKVRALAKEVREIDENNIALQYEVDRFESPVHLMELSRQPQFSHLKFPYLNDIIILPQKTAIPAEENNIRKHKSLSAN